MTPSEFEALLDALPHGLHDAELLSLTVDGTLLTPAWIDGGSGSPDTAPRPDLQAPNGGFLAWIYLESIEGFIRIGARSASLDWLPDRPATP